jgi:hypothetical protein
LKNRKRSARFCPSCHLNKVQLFGALLAESILSSIRCRTGISCSASQRCSTRTSATTAICSKTSAASPTSA